jgi:hypothetical protein
VEGSSVLRTCPKCGASEDLRDSAFCPSCGGVLKTEHPPQSLNPLSEAPDTEQSGTPKFVDEASATIAEDGEPPSLQLARASGLEKAMPTPAEPKIEELPPPPFRPAPERLSAPDSWLRPSAELKKIEADATSLDAKPPAMTGAIAADVAAAANDGSKPIEKTVEDLDDEAKKALAGMQSGAAGGSRPLPKGTTAPHMLPGHEGVEKMLSIPAGPSLPIAIALTLGRLLLAAALSAFAAIGYGFLRERVGADLVKALSLNPRGPVLDVAFGVLFVVTSFAFGYGVFHATAPGWRTPKWRRL